ncbi:MAG: class I SAM-dependent methyltransferase [Alphaproteobacteria bacterium]
MKTEYLGPTTDLEVIDRLLALDGLIIVDVGCNDGTLTRNLATRGAQVHGLEPNPIQAASNREAEAVSGVTFHEAPAQAMPFEDGSVDGVIFSRSLHHVPEAMMDQALREAMRILKPDTGFLYILEPEMGGQFSQLLKPFHDETLVRLAALAALTRTVEPRFEDITEYWFTQVAHYANLEELRDRMLANTFNSFKAEEIDQPVVHALFEAGKTNDGYSFSNPMRIQLYRGLKN